MPLGPAILGRDGAVLDPTELVQPLRKSGDPVGLQPAISTIKTIAVSWSSPVPAAVNGIIHVPAHNTPIKPGRREALLIAIDGDARQNQRGNGTLRRFYSSQTCS